MPRIRFEMALLAMTALLLASAVASAQESGAIGQLRSFMTTTPSARGDFEQISAGRGGRAKEVSSGTFAFTRPGKFRWEVRKPFEQLMVADGEQLYFYDRDLNQVVVKKLGEALGQTPAAVLFGSGDPERSFALRDLPERDGLAWAELIPKARDAGLHRIAIGFRNGLPVQMEVLDAFERTTWFTFTAVVRSPKLAADTFRFAIPPGADVLRQ